MASAHLSEDPLRLVFDHILGDGYARRLLPLLTVSKRWKVRRRSYGSRTTLRTPSQELVTPLFFKRIALTSESNMDAAAAAIRKHEGHGNHVGGFIRRLDLEQIPLDARSTRIKASFIDRAAALILHAVNVEHLSLPVQASPVCFALASQHRTLRMLDATITGDNYEGLRYLSAMHGLRQLYIQFWDEPWKRLFDIPEDLDLKLDHLWDINWIDLTNGGSHARFLKSCRFADLTWMDFLEYNLRDERESKDIAAFLRSHPVIVHCAIPLREMAVRHILPDFSHPCLGLRIATEDAPIAMSVARTLIPPAVPNSRSSSATWTGTSSCNVWSSSWSPMSRQTSTRSLSTSTSAWAPTSPGGTLHRREASMHYSQPTSSRLRCASKRSRLDSSIRGGRVLSTHQRNLFPRSCC
jgi:hypothetical protein